MTESEVREIALREIAREAQAKRGGVAQTKKSAPYERVPSGLETAITDATPSMVTNRPPDTTPVPQLDPNASIGERTLTQQPIDRTGKVLTKPTLDVAPEGGRIQNPGSPYWNLSDQQRKEFDAEWQKLPSTEGAKTYLAQKYGFDVAKQPPYKPYGNIAGGTTKFLESLFSRVGSLPESEGASPAVLHGASMAGSILPSVLLGAAASPLGAIPAGMVAGGGGTLGAAEKMDEPTVAMAIANMLGGGLLGGGIKPKPKTKSTITPEQPVPAKPIASIAETSTEPPAVWSESVSKTEPVVPQLGTDVPKSGNVQSKVVPPVASAQGAGRVSKPSPVNTTGWDVTTESLPDNNGVYRDMTTVKAEPIHGATLDNLIPIAKRAGLSPSEADAFYNLATKGELYVPAKQISKSGKPHTINLDKVKAAHESKPASPPSAVGKEPWEMTADEYLATKPVVAIKGPQGELYVGKPGDIHATLYERIPEEVQRTLHSANSGWVDSSGKFFNRYSTRRVGFADAKKANESAFSSHKERVAKALASGKPVPPEVLKDYPDLVPPVASAQGGKELTWETPDEYVYHRTSPNNLESIRRSGLLRGRAGEYPHGRQDIADVVKRIYFGESPTKTSDFGGGLVMRVRKDAISDNVKVVKMGVRGEETWYFGDKVNPSDIEVRNSSGGWDRLARGKRRIVSSTPSKPSPVKTTATKEPWDMSRDELYSAEQSLKQSELRSEQSILGDDFAEWNKAQRQQGSQNNDVANRASETIERIESKLSPKDRDALYGIGSDAASAESLKPFRDAIDLLDDSSPEALGKSIKSSLYRVGEQTDPYKMSFDEKVAYTQIRHAVRLAQENGYNIKDVFESGIRAASKDFSDPADAAMMLKRFSGGKPSPVSRQLPAEGGITLQSGVNPIEAVKAVGSLAKEAGEAISESTIGDRAKKLLFQAESRVKTEPGKELVSMIGDAQERGAVYEGSWLDDLTRAGLKHFDGDALGKDLQMGTGGEEFAAILKNIRDRAVKAGIKLGNVEAYFPRVMKEEYAKMLNSDLESLTSLLATGTRSDKAIAAALAKKGDITKKLIDDMMKRYPNLTYTGAIKMAHSAAQKRVYYKSRFEMKRTLELPSWVYETDAKKVLPYYVKDMATRIADAEVFGAQMQKYKKLDRRIGYLDMEEQQLGQDLMQMHTDTYKDTGRVSPKGQKAKEAVAAFLYGTKIGTGLSVIPNVTQILISAGQEYGYTRALRSIVKLGTNPELRQQIRRAGVVDPEMIKAFTGYTPGGIWGKYAKLTTGASGFNAMNKLNQYWAAAIGKDAIESYHAAAKGTGKYAEWAKARLDDLGIDHTKPLTDDILLKKMWRIANDTQLRSDILKEPTWMNDPQWRLFGIFKRFGYKQFTYQKELLTREVKQRGNVMPLLRLAAGGYAGGEFVVFAKNKIKEALTGRPAYREDEHLTWERLINNMAAIGSLGVFSDIVGPALGNEPLSNMAKRTVFAATPVVVSEGIKASEKFVKVAKDTDKYGVGKSLKRNAPDMVDFVGQIPGMAAERLKSDKQTGDSIKNLRGDKRMEIIDDFNSGNSAEARRKLRLWNKNYPRYKISADDVGSDERLKRKLANKKK